MNKELQNTRKDYTQKVLDREHVQDNPMEQFTQWYKEYTEVEPIDPNAMTLCTTKPDGQPTARIVLLKGLSKGGFEFYTNYKSAKGKDMEQNPHVCLNFFWPELERQIRVEGIVEKLTPEESDEYFYTRPLGSRIGAWASPQSEIIEGRQVLEDKLKELTSEMGEDVSRPPHWGGYRIMPRLIEFWQGRANRLHDRLVYEQTENGKWRIVRLAP